MRVLMKIMRLRPGQIPEHRAVTGVILSMAMTMTTARLRRISMVVKQELDREEYKGSVWD